MILADRWIEYVRPVYEKTINDYKELKKQEILNYDSSSSVNEFSINGMHLWLDKATRAGLKLRFESEKNFGVQETTLWHNGLQFPLTIKLAFQMLYALEVYASACYDNTQRHLAEVEKLETIEEVDAYNYRTGYPDKLRF